MILDYFEPLKNMSTYCQQFKEWVTKSFFMQKTQYGYEKSDTAHGEWYCGHFCYHPDYQQRLEVIKRCIQISHVFGIAKLNVNQPKLLEKAHKLGQPELVKTRGNLEENLDSISGAFASEGFPITTMISQMHSTETERLLEAVHSLFEGCRYSAVAMAVSAIEFRLLEFMRQVNASALKELETKPLGFLIDECLTNAVYSKVLPERHRPLLSLCNQFRIFSVHPKTELIGQNEAMSVINLAFSFILDSRIRKASREAFGS